MEVLFYLGDNEGTLMDLSEVRIIMEKAVTKVNGPVQTCSDDLLI